MLNLSSIRVSTSKMDNGVIWEIGVKPDGTLEATVVDSPPETKAWIRTAAPNIAFRRAQALAQKPHLDAIRKGKVTDDLEAEINGEALCVLVLDWGNISSSAGEEFPCTEENKRTLLMDRSWSNFYNLVDAIVNTRAALLEETTKDSLGNSSADLNGTSISSSQVGANSFSAQ